MPSEASRIALVFDRDFGGKLAKLAETQPVWICDSTINRPAAQSLWDEGLTSGEVTLFQMTAADPAVAFSETLDMVDQHHPNWSQLQVIGIEPSKPIKAVLLAHSGGSIETAEDSFAFKRSAN